MNDRAPIETDDSRVEANNVRAVRLWYELGIIAFIAAVEALIRLPFFFPAVIDWDESTFIITGQSAVDGFLPGEIAWEIKPHFALWWFGGAIELFGKSIPAVRFAGFVWLLLSAYLVYRAALFMTHSKLGGIFAAAMLVVAGSAYSLHVSTELLAILPMTGAILVLCNNGRQLRSVFLGGVLLGLACMFRLNLVFLCFTIGAFVCIETQQTSWKAFLHGALKNGVWFSVGVLAPIVVSFLPYFFSGHWQLWVSVYEAAVSYSEEQLSLAKNVMQTLHESATYLFGATMWGAAILGAFILSRRWRDLTPKRQSDWLLCGAFVVGSFGSIVMTGPNFEHYYAQLVPGLSMFAAAAFIQVGKNFSLSKSDWIKFVSGICLILLAVFRTAGAEWGALAHRFWKGEPLSYGIEYDIAKYIRTLGIEDFSLFMMDKHLVYWLLGRYAPTRLATHPSNLGKPFIRKHVEPSSQTTEDALRSVFRREPTLVVGPPKFGLDPAAARFLEYELTNAYVLIGQIGSSQIYRRRF